MDAKKETIPVALVNGVYFPFQRLRFKVNDPSKQIFNMKDGYYGIVSKRFHQDSKNALTQGAEKAESAMQPGGAAKLPSHKFQDHYSVGVFVQILDQQQVISNLVQNYAEFGVQAVQRFRIDKVVLTHDDRIIKVCEVTLIDDLKQYTSLPKSAKRNEKLVEFKEKGLKLVQMYASLAKSESRVLMNHAIRINQAGDQPVTLLFLIAFIIRYQSREQRQEVLEIDCFDQRLARLDKILADEMSRIQELMQRADTYNRLDKEERRDAIRNIFKKIQSNDNSQVVPFKKAAAGGGARKPGNFGNPEELNEVDQLFVKIKKLNLPAEADKIVQQELRKLKNLDPRNQEYHVSLNYLTTISNLPWNIAQEENQDPVNAREILDRDHFGLEQVKKRIVQFLAVRKLKKNSRGSIMCLYGPPGVGKTSLGKSVAEALNRKFYKIALGGVRDEAEIRGHRRTYVGAMPGVIIQSLIKIKTNNPVFLLDEIDKLGRDARGGDPGAALLEVLDPSQNQNYQDHFLGTPFDLSNVLFLATANQLDTIHPALLDRMEIIEISGYSPTEKLSIAERYLVPKQITENGITKDVISFEQPMLEKIIMEYTAESGVRSLERSIGSVCRAVAYDYAVCADQSKFQAVQVSGPLIEDALGTRKFDHRLNERILRPGVAIGLAYTSIGGSALLVETTKYPGTGQLKLTGKLGEVMRESVNTSISWIQANASKIGILTYPLSRLTVTEAEASVEQERQIMKSSFKDIDLHVHFPAAATPKDGPSAGVTITVALVSLFTSRRVRSDFAMTGEVSLQGLALPVGGIKEKCMAAHRNGIKNVILPKQNEKDLKDLPDDLKSQLKIHFASNVTRYLELALEKNEDTVFKQEQMLEFSNKRPSVAVEPKL